MLTHETQDKQVWLAQYTRHAHRDYLIQSSTRQVNHMIIPYMLASHVYQYMIHGSYVTL